MTPRQLHHTDLDRLIGELVGSGHQVIGPVPANGVIDLGPIRSVDDLPRGWSDVQQPGRYRTSRDDTTRLFGYAAPSRPWKRYLHPERVLLLRSHKAADGVVSIEPAAEAPLSPLAFVGIRGCDLAAIQKLDVVLARDPDYQRRRADMFIVAVACTSAAETCFCASAGTGPRPGPGADIIITELGDQLVAEPQTPAGTDLLDRITATGPASSEQVDEAAAAVADCGRSQQRALDPEAIALAAARLDDAGWQAVADRCLTCGNCTMACPTCFCTSVSDHTDLVDGSAERSQSWASCFSVDFSEMHGGAVRSSPAARYRQWYLHKLVTWHDQFGSSGCVGCGRCITWCPTGIDITEAVVR